MALLPFAFSSGVGLLALPFALPVSTPAAILAMSAGVVVWAFVARRLPRRWRVLAPAVFLAGFGYAVVVTRGVLDSRLPTCSDGAVVSFELRILSAPEALEPGFGQTPPLRFVADVGDIDPMAGCPGFVRHRLRLTWYDPPELAPGQRWRGEGRLRPVWGHLNPGGFDYERWLLGERLDGTGYVRAGTLLESAPATESWRSRLAVAIGSGPYPQRGLMLALLLGEDALIERGQWAWLRDSGLIHLVVVSGLHVAIVALAAFRLGMGLARLCPALLERFGARRLATPFAVVGSAGYVLLTGTGTPAQRAWLMSSIAICCLVSGRRVSTLAAFAWVLAAVLLADPLAIHQQGFWLSFAAVAALLGYFLPSRSRSGPVLGLLRAQGVLFCALTPLIALLQQAVPLAGPLVNLFAVPLVSLLVLPLLLICGVTFAISPDLAALGFRVADALLAAVARSALLGAELGPLAAAPGQGWRLALPVVSAALLLCRPALHWRALLVAAWLGLLAGPVTNPGPGHFRLTALDVGQGSALLIETRHRRLLFDTGPAYPGGFDLGVAVVVPSLTALGVRRLDAVVLSHADLDHSGGAEAVLARLPVGHVWSSYDLPEGLAGQHADSRCAAGLGWIWDSVVFEFLNPGDHGSTDDNDGSCVLRVRGLARSALLTGDISKRVERRLLARGMAPVDVTTAPHHGSNGSSSAGWVRALDPRFVFVSAPRQSRYGHPHPDVVRRYREQGAVVLVTGLSGSLVWSSETARRATTARDERRAYWRDRSVAPGAASSL